MADVHTKEIRSKNMAAIKGKDTKPEMLVRRFLHAHGFRYKLHDKTLPGNPGIVLPKYKTVIFIHYKVCNPGGFENPWGFTPGSYICNPNGRCLPAGRHVHNKRAT
jgi:DNA mismatch endonuclease (patch repair protein)